MHRYRKPAWALAAALAALAGYVDAIGFLKLGGLFVSFMSGNTTRLATRLATGAPVAVIAGGLVAAFVGGVIAGGLLAVRAGDARKPAVLALVALLLAAAALADRWHRDTGVALLLAAAMGAENNVFQRNGEVAFGVTYMTGALVKLGQQVVAALTGGAPFGWVPYLLLWLGLLAGAVAGATLYLRIGAASLWVAVAGAMLTAVATAMSLRRRSPRPPPAPHSPG